MTPTLYFFYGLKSRAVVAGAHVSQEQPALRQGRPRCRRVGWCWNLRCQESLDQLVSALSRLLHNARYSAVSRWSFWLGAERWLQALVLILDRPASSFVDTYDAAHICAIAQRVRQHRSVCRLASYSLTYNTWSTSHFLWVLAIGCGGRHFCLRFARYCCMSRRRHSSSRDWIIMSAIFASLDNRFSVASLRKPSQGLYASTIAPEQVAPSQLARMAALSVTLVRIPIILFGIAALNMGWQLMACTSFVAFALLDYFDGVAARKVGEDTASRRLGDVLLDRISIHTVILLTCLYYGGGWAAWSVLLLRDLLQGGFSSYLLAKYRVIIIGAYWHMSYGIAILIWECAYVMTGSVSQALTVCTAAIVYATGADYIARCLRLVRA